MIFRYTFVILGIRARMSEEGPSSSTMLQPGVVIKPEMTEDTAKELVNTLYGLKVSTHDKTKVNTLQSHGGYQ